MDAPRLRWTRSAQLNDTVATMHRILLLAVLLSGAVVAAGDLTPEKIAQTNRERQKALDEVAKKYGNRKSSELSSDERRQMIRDQDEAVAKVYEKNGVDAKELAKHEATGSSSERAAVREKTSALEKKEADDKKAAEAAAKAKPDDNGVIIERGNGENPPPDSTKPKSGKTIKRGH